MRIRSNVLVPLALVVALGGCDHPTARETRNFAWQGDLSGERWIRVRNLNGPVKVVRSPDARVTIGVVAKGTRLRDLELVREVDGNGVTACVARDGSTDCEPRGDQRLGLNRVIRRLLGQSDGSYSAEFTVYLPQDARIDITTVNGAIDIESAGREFRVKSVNGPVRLTAIGEAFHAETVNGSVTATLDLVGAHGAVELSTVNGSVTAEMPSSLSADVSLKTVNGRVSSDFLAPVEGRAGARAKSLDGVVGTASHRVSLKTVNGSASLRTRG